MEQEPRGEVGNQEAMNSMGRPSSDELGWGAADGATEVRAIARPTLKVMALQSSCRNGELYIRGKSIVLLMPTHIRVYTHSQTHMYRHTYIYTNTPTNTHTYRYTQTLQSLLTKHTSLIYT